jgi:hypothetical protein
MTVAGMTVAGVTMVSKGNEQPVRIVGLFTGTISEVGR